MTIEFFPSSSRGAEERRALAEKILRGSKVSPSYLDFGYDYFDNPEHGVGYGGYRYDGRYAEVAKRMVDHYGLKPGDRVLEIGCAKGFLLVEFLKLGMEVAGIDASDYAVENAHPEVRPFIRNAPAVSTPYPDGHFQLVIGKEVLPHVPRAELEQTVQECMRVSNDSLFFEIQCGTSPRELQYMQAWDRTHQVCETPAWWNEMFARVNYPGDVHFKVLISEGEGDVKANA